MPCTHSDCGWKYISDIEPCKNCIYNLKKIVSGGRIMGDRHTFSLDCPYCGKMNEEVYYASSAGFMSHKCDFCKKEFIIELEFIGKKATKKEIKQFYKEQGFG